MKPLVKIYLFASILWTSEFAYALVTMPQGCLGQKSACAVKTGEDTFRTKALVNAQLFLFHNTSIFVDSSGYLFLLEGILRSQAETQVQVRSIFADFSFSGDVYFLSERERILVRNIDGEMKITLRDGQELVLPEGFEIWIAGLDIHKKSTVGMYRKLDLKDHIRLWSQSFEGSKSAFLKNVADYKESYVQAQKNEVELYRGIAGENQKQNEYREQSRERRRIRDVQKKIERRRLFYERSFSR